MNNNNTVNNNAAPALYLITNDDALALLLQKLQIVFSNDIVKLLQIRRKQVLAKEDGKSRLLQESKKIIDLAGQYGVAVVINDDIALANQLNTGVHLGQDDGSIQQARQCLGSDAIIGSTCHQSIHLVQKAKQHGASYAAMGAVFPSSTKPNAKVLDLSQLEKAKQCDISLCAIGGITADNVIKLKPYNLDYIAVVGDMLNTPLKRLNDKCQAWQKALSGMRHA